MLRTIATWCLCVLVVILPGCAHLTEAQRAEYQKLAAETTALREELTTTYAKLQEARDKAKRGELTQAEATETSNRLVAVATEIVPKLAALEAKMSALNQASGISPLQGIWEGGGREVVMAIVGGVLGRQLAVQAVRKERGPATPDEKALLKELAHKAQVTGHPA